ncbi:MAG: 2,3,4,5-tetrahydropyridine-2,6-carboxylate N-succinyltransferase [Rhodobacteraceae bacterium CG17_big_fil_post_rev_8_21_14_2_50_65_11]|nr:MAG: 2,3,4,5-tetrahydropyridine-2,6-carboxylate N-succinyltransferase [Rhodobacteraceae bacterium CG17_big_fil_post_rev_8_21_14_2_50_65_11]
MPVPAERLNIDTNANANEMADTIFGDGVQVVNATYDGDKKSSGIWTDGDAISPDATPSDIGVILSTGKVKDFTNKSGDPNQSGSTSTNTKGVDYDSGFNTLAGTWTYDAAILEVDFIPDGDTITMQFTFASEEYPEYVGSIFNDAVGIWVNGVEVASPVFDIAQINNVNNSSNETLYVDNTDDHANTEMDGYTVTLSVTMIVNPDEVNTIRLGIADVGDSNYDSAILIAGDSIQATVVAQDDEATVFEGQTAVVDVTANDDSAGTMIVTHVNGQEVSVGDTVTLNNGFDVTLQADGSLAVVPPAGYGGLPEPESFNFSYTAEDDSNGITDSAFVTITSIPCFAAGTRILTVRGQRPVESLKVGDLIETRDNGMQPIRWIGRRRVRAEGRFAPVVIEAGAMGAHDRLVLSPQHRVLVQHHMAELLFGEGEVLIAAKDLVNDRTIRIREGGEIEYLHLLFDEHQILWSDGLPTESFHPGPVTLNGFEDAVRDEILGLFPEIDLETGIGYSAAARPSLRGYEAAALLA